jgi:hypothetical protein
MTETSSKVHHQTRKAADISLAKKQISPASYRAILAGEIGLREARDLGRSGSPTDATPDSGGPGTATETLGSASAEDYQESVTECRKLCLCGCGAPVTRIFKAGHDSRLLSELRGQIKKGDVLLRSEKITDEQREFAVRHGLISEEALPPQTEEED